ncbi:MAG: 3'-5' exonuclease [Microscillaceae bacterium]
MTKYLQGLNPPQAEAVLHTEGPLMIIAGAGSGKTRVLTHRIAHLIQNGVSAFQIMALTFTNKAAGEMRHRIEHLVGTEARSLWMGTFHSIFARILRFEAEKLGYTSSFSIYDTEDSKSLLRTIIKEQGLDDKVYRPSNLLHRISSAKNRLISWQDYQQDAQLLEEDRLAKRGETARLYQSYQERCFKANAMDFDDLLFNINWLLERFSSVRQKYQEKFRYILIDEFQDTNLSQYHIVRHLAAQHRNICVVGDDAQSIYAFRGADIQNILNFEHDYPELKIIRLEQNYRSTQTIVEAANSLIAKNQHQLKKKVWTANDPGLPIRIIRAVSDNDEGRQVAQSIFEEKQHHQYQNRDFAILYRTNAQSRAMEEALRKLNLKYRIIGGLSFYQRREIKDLIAYLRLTINQNDEEAFKRIINLPKRGIGDTTIARIMQQASQNGTSLWQALKNSRLFLKGRAVSAIEDFVVLLEYFAQQAQSQDAYTVAAAIAKQSGLLKDLYEDKTIEGLSRYENVQELLNAIKEFVDNPDNQNPTLAAFLQEVSLLTSADEASDGDDDKITLMTIHAAKGLEFKQIFVVGLEEELFPSAMMLQSRADLEEERRLFYVAVTRAEQKLTLTFAQTRYFYGRLKNCTPSRFLAEIDAQFLQEARGTFNPSAGSSSSLVAQLKPRASRLVKIPTQKTASVADFVPSDTSGLKVGMKVEHVKFGLGMVLEVQAFQNDRKARIDFEDYGEKTLLLSFVKLKIHAS